MSSKTTLRIGIASRDEMKARTLAVARGAHKRSADEPKVWFTSATSLSECLASRGPLRTELMSRLKQR